MNKPFIKLLHKDNYYYFYDVNCNKIVKISPQSYDDLNKILLYADRHDISIYNEECKAYFQKGFLQPNIISDINRGKSVVELITLLNSNLKSLLLQVTRDCNLRCKYCFYSGQYPDIRIHEKNYMDINMSKKIIDYFFHRTSLSDVLTIGFYGGEPLLNIQLIQDAVEYILHKYSTKKIQFSITTNGVLLSPTVWKFLEKHNFLTTISFDGPQEIHDANRVFPNGSSSFSIIFENIKYGFENHQNYFKTNIRLNAVITKEREKVEKFFESDPILKLVSVKLSDLNNYHNNNMKIQQTNLVQYKNEKTIKSHKARILIDYLKHDGKVSNNYSVRIENMIDKLNATPSHPLIHAIGAGVCMPGISRLFATVNGDFYMCEKVNDNSEDLKIGNVFDGWNEKNIYKLANISNESPDQGCKKCWAINLCNMCAAKICALGTERLNQKCNEVRKNIEEELYDICTLYEIRGKVD